jgi:hypothetical protein
MAHDASDDHERRAAARFARRINYDLRLLHEAAPWVESARQGSLGLGLVYFVDEMVEALLTVAADVVMAPTPDYMYSTVFDIPKWIEGTFNIPIPDGPTAMVVAYPTHEPDSLFLHLLIAHELGHSVVPAADLINKVRSSDPDPNVTGSALAQAATKYAAKHGDSAHVARLTVARMLRDWLTELLCDAVALAFLGPPFIFTTAAFGTPFEQTASESHPPFGLRTETLVTHLDLAGWKNAAERVAPETFGWIATPSATPADPDHPYFEDVERAVRHLAPSVTAIARAHVGARVFQYRSKEVQQLVHLLDERVLPVEYGGKPADRRSIVLAGWVHAFKQRADDAASLAAITADRAHQRFLTKALEMSIVLEKWRTLA